MTTLYLIRHGIAAERGTYANDGDRPLTDKGKRKTEQVAQRLRALDITVDLILSSPLVRARQTADILKHQHLGTQIEVSDDLAPAGDIHRWLHWLNVWRGDRAHETLAIVGHQPDLGLWAEILVWGRGSERLVVKKAGVMGLTLPDVDNPIGQSELFWLTPPRLLL